MRGLPSGRADGAHGSARRPRLLERARRRRARGCGRRSRVSTATSTERPGRSRPASAWSRGHGDAHRHALHDLGEVAGRVLRRQQAELRAAGRREALDRARQLQAGIGVDRDRAPAGPGRIVRDLRLLEVGDDIDLRQRHHDHQPGRRRARYCADLGAAVADHAVDRRADHRVVEVELRLLPGRPRPTAPRPGPAAGRPPARRAAPGRSAGWPAASASAASALRSSDSACS